MMHYTLDSAVTALCDDDWQVRESAAEALIEFGQVAVPDLIKAMEDYRDEVRQDAASVLNQIGWKPATEEEIILYAFASQQWDMLVEMGEAAISVLSIAVQDQNFYVRTSAVLGLGEIGHELGLPLLERAMRDKNGYVRSASARSLSRFGPQAAQVLGLALQDEDKSVRSEAAKSLVQIGEAAVPVLVKALKECDWYLRREVAQALVKVGAKTVSALIPLLQDGSIAPDAAQILRALNVDPARYGYQEAGV